MSTGTYRDNATSVLVFSRDVSTYMPLFFVCFDGGTLIILSIAYRWGTFYIEGLRATTTVMRPLQYTRWCRSWSTATVAAERDNSVIMSRAYRGLIRRTWWLWSPREGGTGGVERVQRVDASEWAACSWCASVRVRVFVCVFVRLLLARVWCVCAAVAQSPWTSDHGPRKRKSKTIIKI